MFLLLSANLLVASQVPSVPTWRLAPAPLVTIGGEAHPEVEFLRIGNLQLLEAGGLLVANGDPPELRFFDASGKPQRQVGRTGDGPGEFRRLGWAAVRGDSLLAFDLTHRRLTAFGPDGKVLASLSLPSDYSFVGAAVAGRLRCGAWLTQPTMMMGGRVSREGISRDTTPIALRSPGLDRVVATLGAFPGPTTVVILSGEGDARRMAVGPAQFGASTLSGTADSLVYTLDTATPELHLWDCAGQHRRAIQLPIPHRPLLPAVVRELKDSALASARNEAERGFIEQRYRPELLPDRLPTVRSIVPGPGELWIEQYEADPTAPSIWWVVDLMGKVRAKLQSPARFRIRSVTRDRVAGVALDADGVESVRIYQFRR